MTLSYPVKNINIAELAWVFRLAWLADNELITVSNFAHKFFPHRL